MSWTTGSDFFLSDDDLDAAPIWGDGSHILWSEGEPFMIAGDDGTGKTTIAHQLIAGRLGFLDELLGYTVRPMSNPEGIIVYLAMDRPKQARRAGRRLMRTLDDDQREVLDERLQVWEGPLPVNPLESPEAVLKWLQAEFGDMVSDVFVDSVKDMVPSLSDDTPAANYNLCLQALVTSGIEVVDLHHQRKASAQNTTPNQLADVYGSRWLTAGHGSVVMLSHEDRESNVIRMSHRKPVQDVVPSMVARHDGPSGRTALHDGSHTASSRAEDRNAARVYDALYKRKLSGNPDPMTLRALTKHMGMSRPVVSAWVATGISRGWLTETPGPRNSKLIDITDNPPPTELYADK